MLPLASNPNITLDSGEIKRVNSLGELATCIDLLNIFQPNLVLVSVNAVGGYQVRQTWESSENRTQHVSSHLPKRLVADLNQTYYNIDITIIMSSYIYIYLIHTEDMNNK